MNPRTYPIYTRRYTPNPNTTPPANSPRKLHTHTHTICIYVYTHTQNTHIHTDILIHTQVHTKPTHHSPFTSPANSPRKLPSSQTASPRIIHKSPKKESQTQTQTQTQTQNSFRAQIRKNTDTIGTRDADIENARAWIQNTDSESEFDTARLQQAHRTHMQLAVTDSESEMDVSRRSPDHDHDHHSHMHKRTPPRRTTVQSSYIQTIRTDSNSELDTTRSPDPSSSSLYNNNHKSPKRNGPQYIISAGQMSPTAVGGGTRSPTAGQRSPRDSPAGIMPEMRVTAVRGIHTYIHTCIYT